MLYPILSFKSKQSYFFAFYKKIKNQNISLGGFSDISKSDLKPFETFDQTSNFCWPNSTTSNPCNVLSNMSTCCCDNTACNYGPLRSIFRVMKETMYHPHFLDLDSRMYSFNGNISESFISKPPSYITEELMGYKLIGPDSFKDQANPQRHFFTPEPFIPFCKINHKWTDLPMTGAERVFKIGKYCTFFRPMLTDFGVCYTMNSFVKVCCDTNKKERNFISYYY